MATEMASKKQQLVDAIQTEREALLAVLDGIDEVRLTTAPVCGPWTAKDVLGHLAAIDIAILDVIADARRGAVLVWPWATYANGDDWNAAMVGARRERSLASVRAEFEQTYLRLVAELQSWPEEAGPFGPESWDQDESPIGWLPSHDREHARAIASLARGFG